MELLEPLPDFETGPYEPERLVATGTHAEVWFATGPKGNVALKIAREEKYRDTLAREVRVHELGEHPNLVKLLDRAPDHSWLALERIDGLPIDAWTDDEEVEEVVRVHIELLKAIAHLHDHDVVHGDIKPRNVLVDNDGRVHLLDLGLAKMPGDKVTAGFRGTLGYAAPEMLQGKAPTKASDLYAVGASLYRCLTGNLPFVADDPAALTYLPLVTLPPPPTAVRPTIPKLMNTLVLTLLARNPARRLTDISKVISTLEKSVTGALADPMVGMDSEREELRQAVVGASDGETRVVVVYGPPGSGRRTLIQEAVETARREGLPFMKGADIKQMLAAIKKSRSAPVVVMRGDHRGPQQLASYILQHHLGVLLLLRGPRPLPELAKLGAIHVTPSPLTLKHTTHLVEQYGADVAMAEDWWRQTLGLPVAIMANINRWRADQGHDIDPVEALPVESRRIYASVKKKGTVSVLDLARALKITEHEVLDHCAVLFAAGLFESAGEGAAVRAV